MAIGRTPRNCCAVWSRSIRAIGCTRKSWHGCSREARSLEIAPLSHNPPPKPPGPPRHIIGRPEGLTLPRSTDVFVIGGGPAGLAAAIAARRRGFDVTLADGAVPPIDKACGEGIMPDGIVA